MARLLVKAFSISGLAAYLKKWYIHLDQVLFISVEKTPTSSGGE